MNRKIKKSTADNRSVDINDEYAMDFWTKELNVTAAKLKAAVLAAGAGLPDVKRELTRPKTA
jgi:hypothetical protein